jgi:hypothetical protein
MCPACISTAAAIAAGVVSGGGVAAIALVALGRKPRQGPMDSAISQGDDDAAAENRNAR